MAARGARPKPSHLRLVDGSHRRDRHGERARAQSAAAAMKAAFGPPLRPTHLKGASRRAWDRYIAPAHWLDTTREPAAIIFCELWAEYRKTPWLFHASKHAQLRRYMSDLGLTDERNRQAR